MTTLPEFRAFALDNMMELEAILAEVYAGLAAGQTSFAMFDGGAHKAFHTLRMLALPGCVRVHAVEADPFMANTFRDIVSRHSPEITNRIVFHQKALQDDPELASIPWKSSPSHVGRSSIVSPNPERSTIWDDNPDMRYRDEMTVPATTIDTILASEDLPVPFLKLDLEGADLLALSGAEKTLTEKRPVVAFENSIHAPKVHGFSIKEKIDFFQQIRYVPLNFIGAPMKAATWFGFFEAWLVPYEFVAAFRKHLDSAMLSREISIARYRV